MEARTHYNQSAERAAIAAALASPAAAAFVASTLTPDHFGQPSLGRIAARIRAAIESGEAVSPWSLATTPAERADITALIAEGGHLAGPDGRKAAMLVHEAFMRRSALLALATAHRALDGGTDIFESVARALDVLVSVTDVSAFADVHAAAAAREALDRVDQWERGEVTDLAPTGFLSLDRSIGGYPVGEITILAGMTGAGKTSFLAGSCLAAAQRESRRAQAGQGATVVFSAEMTREQLAHRMASTMTGVSTRELQRRMVGPSAFAGHRDALRRIAALPLFVDDTPSPSLAHVQARCQQIAMRHAGRLALIAFDYDEKADVAERNSEELRVSKIVQGFKAIAKRMKAPLLLLSQYSRKASYDAVPSDDWLRMSGKKEQEAGVILHWHYPQYWVEKGIDPAEVKGFNAADPTCGHIICTKNRFGPQRDTLLRFDAPTTRFVDPAHVDAPAPTRADAEGF